MSGIRGAPDYSYLGIAPFAEESQGTKLAPDQFQPFEHAWIRVQPTGLMPSYDCMICLYPKNYHLFTQLEYLRQMEKQSVLCFSGDPAFSYWLRFSPPNRVMLERCNEDAKRRQCVMLTDWREIAEFDEFKAKLMRGTE